jgi:hypothetical protein
MLTITVTDSLDFLQLLAAASAFDAFGFWTLARRFDADIAETN